MIPDSVCLRPYEAEDQAQLKDLWCRVFGDPPSLTEEFFRLLPEMGSCFVAEQAGEILGAAYLIDGLALLSPGEKTVRCGYLYAVAVDAAARGQGIGAAVSRGAAALGRARGAELLCTLPAELSLYRWYEEILSLRWQSTRKRWRSNMLSADAEKLTASDYCLRREAILQNVPHMAMNDAAMTFQQRLCEAYGGGLYHADGLLFCAYQEDCQWVIPELLADCPEAVLPEAFFAETLPYVCSDLPFPDGFIWNLSFD